MVESSFNLNAILLAKIFDDDFNRSVDPGLGGPWHWDKWDSSVLFAEETTVSVDGANVIDTLPLSGTAWDSYNGFPLPTIGGR